MKRIFVLVFLLTSFIASAQKVEKGWKNLFNGKDLSGWKQVNGKAPYTVENGMIVGTTITDSPNSFIITEETFGDFILELDVKMDDGTNSGIQFRSERKADFLDGKVF